MPDVGVSFCKLMGAVQEYLANISYQDFSQLRASQLNLTINFTVYYLIGT